MCRVLAVSRSGYYAWRGRGPSRRQCEDAVLLERIKESYVRGRKVYGSPRITKDLKAEGMECGRRRVARLMRSIGLRAKTKRRFKVTTDSRHKLPVAPNLLERNFTAEAPDKVWVSDITCVWTSEGWLYLLAVLDIYSRKIVGWSTGLRLTESLAIEALKQAVHRRMPEKGLLFHSDRGGQYAGSAFRYLLKRYGMVQSMSKKGDCWDNAVMESFFHTMKTEHVYFEKYATRAEAKRKLFDYIELFYNRQRRHSTLGYVSPVEYENAAPAA